MSWSENGRKNRMTKIMELLKLNRERGLMPMVIARETGKNILKHLIPFSRFPRFLEEITKARFMQYIEELKWAGKIKELRDGRIVLTDFYQKSS